MLPRGTPIDPEFAEAVFGRKLRNRIESGVVLKIMANGGAHPESRRQLRVLKIPFDERVREVRVQSPGRGSRLVYTGLRDADGKEIRELVYFGGAVGATVASAAVEDQGRSEAGATGGRPLRRRREPEAEPDALDVMESALEEQSGNTDAVGPDADASSEPDAEESDADTQPEVDLYESTAAVDSTDADTEPETDTASESPDAGDDE
jgi:hypothetical protein